MVGESGGDVEFIFRRRRSCFGNPAEGFRIARGLDGAGGIGAPRLVVRGALDAAHVQRDEGEGHVGPDLRGVVLRVEGEACAEHEEFAPAVAGGVFGIPRRN